MPDDQLEYCADELPANLTQLLNEAATEHKSVKITAYGKVAGYFVLPEDMAYYETLEDQLDKQSLNAVLAKGPGRKTYTLAEVESQLGL